MYTHIHIKSIDIYSHCKVLLKTNKNNFHFDDTTY